MNPLAEFFALAGVAAAALGDGVATAGLFACAIVAQAAPAFLTRGVR